MRSCVCAAIGVLAALSVLHWNRVASAEDADASAIVRVKYASGDTELDTIKEGVKYFTNHPWGLQNIPTELLGTTFSRRAGGKPTDVEIDASADTTVYVLVDSDKGVAKGAAEQNKLLAASGWTRLTDAEYIARGVKKCPVAVYRQNFSSQQTISVEGLGWAGAVVAAKNLALHSDDRTVEKKPETPPETSTVHNDPSPDNAPIAGPATRISNALSSIQTLEVYTTDSGMMLGRTSEVVLTVTPSDTAKLVSARFVTPVGDQMCMARDEALRFIRVTYHNWYAGTAELSFEDKYTAHDGGSIGAALGTLILSAVQGFDIDSNTAITGDISANGKVRAIGGVSAKIRGATASQCKVVALPMENLDQLIDMTTYSGPATVTNIQVIGISNLNDAVAVMRVDRDAKLVQAIALFDGIRQSIKKSPDYLHSKEAQDKLGQVLELAPQHLSAKLLLLIANDQQPKTLSPTASMYYTFVAVRAMLPILTERSQLGDVKVPSTVVRDGLDDLKKLRPMADESVRPLIDAWSRFIWGWNMFQAGNVSRDTVESQAQAIDDAMAKLQADQDLMQKMLKEGI